MTVPAVPAGAETDTRTLLARAVVALKQSHQQIEALESASREPIAVIGIGCRFPGAVDGPESFWAFLERGGDGVRQVPPSRWNIESWFDPDPAAPGRMYSRVGGFIDELDRFDAAFFGISPREASSIDPQHRLLLETSWSALEDAGVPPHLLAGTPTGVFVGITANDYGERLVRAGVESLGAHFLTGNSLNFAAGRLAYVLGLRGPAMAIDTACSSSLVAVHLASQSLRGRECDLALVGGVNALISPIGHLVTCKARMQSPSGRCHTFDASADGIVRGEGCGVVVLKRLSDALRDADRVYAVIRGSAVNQDGSGAGLTVPNAGAQAAVIHGALRRAGIAPDAVSYVEAHGTGTPLGDPIELRALAEVFAPGRSADRPLRVGSVKTNLGHLESAAGIAGLIKSVLAVRRRVIPSQLHLQRPTPHFDWNRQPIRVVDKPYALPAQGPVVVGVSSFGASGTNAHVLIADAPPEADAPVPVGADGQSGGATSPSLVLVSARSPEARDALCQRFAEVLAADSSASSTSELRDVAVSSAIGRTHHGYRIAVLAPDAAGAREGLRSRAGVEPPGVIRFEGTVRVEGPPRLGFLFSGQGAQYAGMGQGLLAREPVFAATVDRCDATLREERGPSVRALFESGAPLLDTASAQPAMFVLQVSLAALLRSWGLEPAIVIGHSVGEVAAAAVAGVLTVEDGARLAVRRGRLMASLPEAGAMAAIRAPAALVQAALAEHGAARLALAAVNGPERVVVAGSEPDLIRFCGELERREIRSRRLDVSHAFHSPLMDPILDALEEAIRPLASAAPTLPFVSCLDGAVVGQGARDWPRAWRRHAREPVAFARGLQTLAALGCDLLVEVGPDPVLVGLASAVPETSTLPGLPLLRRGRDDTAQLREALGRLYVAGADIDWRAVYPTQRRRVRLPSYPFARERHWPEEDQRTWADAPTSARAQTSVLISEEVTAHPDSALWDHRIYDWVVVPASYHLSRMIELADMVPALAIEDVTFTSALELEGAERRQLSYTRETGAGPAGRFTVDSADTRAGAGQGGEDSDGSRAERHAEGLLTPARAEAPAGLDAPAAAAGAERVVDSDAFYDGYARAGIALGPRFRWVERVFVKGSEAVARMRAPGAADAAPAGVVPPGLLDSLFQVLAAATGELASAGTVHVPSHIARLRALASYPGGATWARAAVRSTTQGGTVTGDLTLFDDDGRPILEVEGLTVRVAPRALLGHALRRRTERMMFEASWEPLPDAAPASPPAGPWLVTGTAGPLARAVVDVLATAGADARRVDPLALPELRGQGASAAPPSIAAIAGVVHRVEEAAADPAAGALDACDGLLRVVHALGAASRGAPPTRLVVVTRGAVRDRLEAGAAGEAAVDGSPGLAHAAVLGLARTLSWERPELEPLLVDLDPSSEPDAQAVALFGALTHAGREGQVACRGDRRYAQRCRRHVAARGLPTPSQPHRLVPGGRGSIADARFEPLDRRAPGPGDVEVAIDATGMNFRDLLNVLGLYPGDPGPMGGECSGRILRTGDGSRLRAGERVAVLFPPTGGFASHATVSETQVFPLPDALSPHEAAGLLVPYITAHHGLFDLGHLTKGQSVLIHSAAGGVGLTAVQLALRAGARVFATAGSPRKRAYLQRQGVHAVFDSRSTTFAAAVRAQTDGRGVDVVLNSLTGEALEESLRLVAEGGRFIELGKRELFDEQRLAALGRRLEYLPFDIVELGQRDPAHLRALVTRALSEAASGSFRPLPTRLFASSTVNESLRVMAGGQHIGRLVVLGPDAMQVAPSGEPVAISAHGSYLVTGGLGALGLAAAEWLARQGARRLALVGRRPPTESAAARIDALVASGVAVRIFAVDVADAVALGTALDEVRRSLAPLRGVIHAAGVLDDGVIDRLNRERLATVLGPKANGAWNLHLATAGDRLDFFCLYGSFVSLFGAPGQGSYAAANAFLDALAAERRQQGRPATAIGWGPWQTGMAAGIGARHRDRWAPLGIRAMSEAEGLRALALALGSDLSRVEVIPFSGTPSPEALGPASSCSKG